MSENNIFRLHHSSVITSNTEHSLKFYTGVLGLKTLDSRPNLPYDGAWLEVGGQQIHLLELPNPDPTTGRPDHGGRDRHIAMYVNKLDDLIARLEAGNIPYTSSASGRRAVFCRDPDGNALEFIENPD